MVILLSPALSLYIPSAISLNESFSLNATVPCDTPLISRFCTFEPYGAYTDSERLYIPAFATFTVTEASSPAFSRKINPLPEWVMSLPSLVCDIDLAPVTVPSSNS
ncbi:MAG: hypothetical protein BWY74_04481 [Firmicutes bacterium ADurb.Bin419]|nr:MAG: hypothetical protein BWY74_04481 [Firmicutes bacterium ADurb.Bin419]